MQWRGLYDTMREVLVAMMRHGTGMGRNGKRGGGPIVTGSPPGGVAHPNEPAGMTAVYPSNPFDAQPPYTPTVDSYGWRCFNSENATNNTNNIAAGYTAANGFPADGCTIQAVSGKLRVNYPAGSLGGYDPSKADAGLGFRAVGAGNSKTQLYFYSKVKLSSAWTNAGNRSTKLVFVRTEDGDSNHEVNLSLGQNPDGSTVSDTSTGFYPQVSYQKGGYGPASSGNIVNNSPPGTYARNVEHEMECYFIMNTPGTADGVARVWVNGVSELSIATMNWVASGTTPGWAHLLVDPTFGGGTHAVPADQWFELDDWYMSVAE